MSGICGLFNLDQAPVAESDVRAMCSMLEQRGPDGTNRWHDGSIGLAHTLLATTLELQFEKQPFTHAETACVITADLRLDNRDCLLSSLAPDRRPETIGDAELVLLAYLAWGEACPSQLLGDFAFAIWDPRQQRLFCARDHFGMRPLYYHHQPGRHFIFASDARAVTVLPRVPYQLNDGRIVDSLVPGLEWIDYTSTFFEGIYRLPPGHKATITLTDMRVVEYWRPQPGPELNFASDDEYRQGFLEVFTDAVESRLWTASGAAGSMLSGGMDSGSIVAVASKILKNQGCEPLETFSIASRGDWDEISNTACEETVAIKAQMLMQPISATLVYSDTLEPNFEEFVSGNEEPFDGEFAFMQAIFRAAKQRGRKVLLDGGSGDVVLLAGSYIARLLKQGKFQLAMAEISAECKYWQDSSFARSFARYSAAAFAPDFIRQMLSEPRRRMSDRRYLQNSLVSRDALARVDIEERFERLRRTFDTKTTDYAQECCNIIRPNIVAGRERYARVASSLGMETRDPFIDKRVVEYTSRLPGRFRQRNGRPKVILQDVMEKNLPREVLWSHRKPHLGWMFSTSLTNIAVARGELSLKKLTKDLADYVDSVTLARAWKDFQTTGDSEKVYTAFVVAQWLAETSKRPASLG